jgi:hypothetical protein
MSEFEVDTTQRKRVARRPRKKPMSPMWSIALGIVLAQVLLAGGCVAIFGVGGCTAASVLIQGERSMWADEAKRLERVYRKGGTEEELCDIAGDLSEAWGFAGDQRRSNVWHQRAVEHKRKAEGRIR